MNGIKMSECRFYVDEAARTVVCVIPSTKNMLVDFIKEHAHFSDLNLYDAINFWDGMWQKSLRMPYSFMGKATCAEEDEWNEELGRKIAFSRAKDKCYRSFFKRANRFVQAIDNRLGDMINLFNDFGMKLENKRDILQGQIDELIKGKE